MTTPKAMEAAAAWSDEPAPQPTYRYLLCDLLTDRVVAQLPLEGVSFARHVSRVGDFKAQLIATTPEQVELARVARAYAGRSALYVLRDHDVWWGGIPWTVQASQGPRDAVQVELQAATFDSYAHHRQLREDVRYDQVDQARIVADLWDRLQADPRGDIGVDTSEVVDTGTLRDREYLGADLDYFGKYIEQLTDVDGGPEYALDVFVDGEGNRRKRLRVANRLGQVEPTAVFTRARKAGGRVLNWTDTTDVVDSGTVFQARGDAPQGNVGQEKEPLLSDVYEATELLDRGWPLLDVAEDFTGVKRLDTLNEHARGLRELYGGPLQENSYLVQVGNSGWNPNRLGDNIRLKLSDLWHRPAVDLTVRPVACKVTAADRGGDETIELTFGE